jgi:predicted ATPase
MDLRGVVRRGGGVNEWVWKGERRESASIDLVVNYPKGKQPLRHLLSFRGDEQGFRLEDERIENEAPSSTDYP